MKYFIRNTEFAFGVDLSRYNASADLKNWPDFAAIGSHEPQVEFIGLRTGQSWGYTDPAFGRFYQQAENLGLCILPYHVIFPGEPALRQTDAFLKILDGIDIDRVRLVLDLELDHGQTRATITNMLICCLEQLKIETERYPIIYSRASWADCHLHAQELPRVDWWLAQYYYRKPFPEYTFEYPCPPALPKGVSSWLIHQTAERAPAIGGLGSFMDYDRWNGGTQALQAYFGRSTLLANYACPLDGLDCPRKDWPLADCYKPTASLLEQVAVEVAVEA